MSKDYRSIITALTNSNVPEIWTAAMYYRGLDDTDFDYDNRIAYGLLDENPEVRLAAMLAVPKLRNPAEKEKVIHLVERGSEDTEPAVRQAAMAICGSLYWLSVIDVLKRGRLDADERVVAEAIHACGKNGTPLGWGYIDELLSPEHGPVAYAAAEYCTYQKGVACFNQPLSTVKKWLENENPMKRLAGAYALRGRKGTMAKSLSDLAICDEMVEVKAAALLNLGFQPGFVGDERLLAELLCDKDDRVRLVGVELAEISVYRELAHGKTPLPMTKLLEDTAMGAGQTKRVANAARGAIRRITGDPYVLRRRNTEPPERLYKKCYGNVLVVVSVPEGADVFCDPSEDGLLVSEVAVKMVKGDVMGQHIGIDSSLDQFYLPGETVKAGEGLRFYRTQEEAARHPFKAVPHIS